MKKILGKTINCLMTPVYLVVGLLFVVIVKVQAFTEKLSR